MWDWLRNAAGAVLRSLPGIGQVTRAYDQTNAARRQVNQRIQQSPQLQARVPKPVQRVIQQPQIPKLNIRDLQQALGQTNPANSLLRQIPGVAPLQDAMRQTDKAAQQLRPEDRARYEVAKAKGLDLANIPRQVNKAGNAVFGSDIAKRIGNTNVKLPIMLPGAPLPINALLATQAPKVKLKSVPGFANEAIVQPFLKSSERVVDVADTKQEYKKGAAGLAQIGTDAYNIGSPFWSAGSASKVAKVGLRAVPEAAIKGGLTGGGINALSQAQSGEKINPAEIALSALIGGAANAGLPLVGRGMTNLKAPLAKFVDNMPARTQGGYIKLPDGSLSRDSAGKFAAAQNQGKIDIHPDDQKLMSKFISYVRSGDYKKNPNADLEDLMARTMDYYGIKRDPKSLRKVADSVQYAFEERNLKPLGAAELNPLVKEPKPLLTAYNKVEVPVEEPQQGIIKRSLARLKANMPERTQGGYVKIPGLGEDVPKRPKGTLNTARLAVTAEQAQDIATRQLPDTSVLSDTQVKQLAKSVGIDLRSNTIEQTREKIAKQLNTRNEIVNLERQADVLRKSGDKVALGNVYRQLRELSQASTEQGTDIARQLSARRIVADATKTPTQRMFLLLDKAGVNPDVYIPKAVNVDFNNANEALKFYRELVPAKASDWIDLVRYNSMLSSPLTQIVNVASTGANISLAPIERTITSNLDFINSLLTGDPRKYAGGEGRAYAKGMAESFPQAIASFKQSLRGLEENLNVDAGLQGGHIPIAAVGQNKAVDVLDFPMRVLGAFDNFNRALVAGGSDSALKRRMAKGIKVVNSEAENTSEAAYRTFNMEIGDKSQGYLLGGIDELTGLVMKARSSKNPVLGNVAKWTLPFVRIGANLMKQGIEYSPAGIATVAGATRKTEQVAKAMIGTAVFGTAAGLLGQNRLTWAEPTDPEQKKAFRAAGMQPYSMKIGDKWIGFQKLPPVISFNFAMVAAIDDARKNAALNDNGVDNIVTAISKYGNFLSDQSYLKNIGDTLAAIKGDPEKLTQLIGNYPQQAIPFRALSGWIARMTDDTQRKVNTDAGFAQKQIENLMQQIPGLRQKTTARVDEQGNPIASQYPVLNAFSPTQISKENPEARQAYDIKMARLATNSKDKANLDKLKKAYLEGDASAAATLTKEQRQAADKSKKEDEVRKTLSPVENQLWSYSKEDLKAMQNGSNGDAVKRVLSLKSSLGSDKATNPKEAYTQALEKYKQDKADGTISTINDISRTKSLKKLEVASKYDQDTIDLYGLSGKELNAYLKQDKNGGNLWKKVVEYDQALYNAGTISKPKFRDSKGNLYIPGTRGKKGRKGRKAKLAKVTKARAIKKVSIRKLKTSSAKVTPKRSVPVLKAKKPARRKITLSV